MFSFMLCQYINIRIIDDLRYRKCSRMLFKRIEAS